MNYQITNDGGNIKFFAGSKEFSLEKSTIKGITVIRDDIIKISTGNCMGSIFIRQSHVTDPATTDATDLAIWLNGMMTEFEDTPPSR
ncbi:MAG: hypothetical protein JSS70_17120 [Bacteroidetes bacterium]|nr:hypothetical protein [Bacteroidota bacterium]